MIMSAVSADMAVELASSAVPSLKEDKIYVDINATSPMTKEEIDSIVSPVAMFVDCAVMGPVPPNKHKVPLSVSGKGARLFTEKMTPYGMKITLMDAPAGSASAIKMMRSIFMKGFVVLVLEMLLAARKYQVADEVLTSVGETIASGPFLDKINGLVGRGVIHSERREHEMDEVIATLKAINVDGIMSKATKDKLRWVTNLGLKEYFKGVPPEDFHEIFAALDKI
jgi:3-hydroxyisobutyrate dehydrogenase-like beta-hydroxyacid dehydrogenase